MMPVLVSLNRLRHCGRGQLPCLADCDYDGNPAHVHMFGICRVIVQLQLRLLIWILRGTNFHQGNAGVLEGCLHIIGRMPFTAMTGAALSMPLLPVTGSRQQDSEGSCSRLLTLTAMLSASSRLPSHVSTRTSMQSTQHVRPDTMDSARRSNALPAHIS